MNMTFFHVPTPEGSETVNVVLNNLIMAMIAKENFIVLSNLATHIYRTNFSTPPVLTTSNVFTGIYRVLSNIQDGAASLEYSLWSCG